MEKVDKLIVAHRENIRSKYGTREKRIHAALNRLLKASVKSGLSTRLVYADDASTMPGVDRVVENASSPEQFKNLIDALYDRHSPDYIVLIGAQDIIPFQVMKNPAWRHDDEESLPTDLPYACDEPFDVDVRKFLAPTRVVARIPDIPGSSDPSYFETLVNNIISWAPKPPAFYQKYFALSTASWKGSTQKNIRALFGNENGVLLSPEEGPSFSRSQLKAAVHLINCHGAVEDPAFYGEKGRQMPEALHVNTLTGKVAPGGIVAAECCYGAQLYNQGEVGNMSIANHYLLEGAIAYLGSTTIAYGPANDLGLADLLAQYFLSNVFKGASTGSALLEARIQFLQQAGPYLDVVELKTFAQFILLGDPSIHPVKATTSPKDRAASIESMDTRENRRENLKARGRALQTLVIPPVHTSQNELPLEVQSTIKQLLRDNKMTGDIRKEVYLNADPRLRERAKASPIRDVKFVVYSTNESGSHVVRRRILVVKKKGLKILGSRLYVSR